MRDEGERLATLETQTQQAARERKTMFRKLDEQDNDLKSIRSDVSAIREQLSGYRGFWAGVVFAASAAAAVIGSLVATLWSKVLGG